MDSVNAVLKEIKDQLSEIRRSERDLERSLDKRFSELADKIHSVSERISIDVAQLKAQSAMVGFFAGALPGLFMFLFDLFKRGN